MLGEFVASLRFGIGKGNAILIDGEDASNRQTRRRLRQALVCVIGRAMKKCELVKEPIASSRVIEIVGFRAGLWIKRLM